MKTVWNAVKKLLIFGVILLLWYLGSRWQWWSAYVLPGPGKVFGTLLDMMASGELAEHLLISLRRVAIGFGISCALTFVFTLVAVITPRVVPLYTRLLGVIRHIPPISLIPLLILWFGIGETPLSSLCWPPFSPSCSTQRPASSAATRSWWRWGRC